MRLCKCYVPLVAVLGLAVAAPRALAASSEAKLEVNENCVEAAWPCWATPGSSQPASKVTISNGGSVTYVDDKTAANIVWANTAPACESSVPVAPAAAKTGWEGKCTFSQPGVYKFESSTLWFEYTKYEVVVEGPASPPPTGEGGSPLGPNPPSPSPTSGENLTGSPLSGAPVIHASQKGATVKGSLQISKSGAGDRLEIDVLASVATPAKSGHTTRVGRFVSASVGAGPLSFSVKLDAKARRALIHRHRLALTVRISLTPSHGPATTVTRSVVQHPRGGR